MTTATTTAPKTKSPDSIRVRATMPGYIGDGHLGMIYRTEGDVFTIKGRDIVQKDPDTQKVILDPDTKQPKVKRLSAIDQFSPTWMEIVDDREPERLTTAQGVIDRQNAELNGGGRPGSASA